MLSNLHTVRLPQVTNESHSERPIATSGGNPGRPAPFHDTRLSSVSGPCFEESVANKPNRVAKCLLALAKNEIGEMGTTVAKAVDGLPDTALVTPDFRYAGPLGLVG
jgi:hypothetical protein